MINLQRVAKSDKQLEKLELMRDDWNRKLVPQTKFDIENPTFFKIYNPENKVFFLQQYSVFLNDYDNKQNIQRYFYIIDYLRSVIFCYVLVYFDQQPFFHILALAAIQAIYTVLTIGSRALESTLQYFCNIVQEGAVSFIYGCSFMFALFDKQEIYENQIQRQSLGTIIVFCQIVLIYSSLIQCGLQTFKIIAAGFYFIQNQALRQKLDDKVQEIQQKKKLVELQKLQKQQEKAEMLQKQQQNAIKKEQNKIIGEQKRKLRIIKEQFDEKQDFDIQQQKKIRELNQQIIKEQEEKQKKMEEDKKRKKELYGNLSDQSSDGEVTNQEKIQFEIWNDFEKEQADKVDEMFGAQKKQPQAKNMKESRASQASIRKSIQQSDSSNKLRQKIANSQKKQTDIQASQNNLNVSNMPIQHSQNLKQQEVPTQIKGKEADITLTQSIKQGIEESTPMKLMGSIISVVSGYGQLEQNSPQKQPTSRPKSTEKQSTIQKLKSKRSNSQLKTEKSLKPTQDQQQDDEQKNQGGFISSFFGVSNKEQPKIVKRKSTIVFK